MFGRRRPAIDSLAALPERVRRAVLAEQQMAERTIGWVQMAIIMTFARYVMLALIVALGAVLILFVSKAVSSGLGPNNAPKDLPDHVEDMSRHS